MTPRGLVILALGVLCFAAAVSAGVERVWFAIPFMLGLAVFCVFSAAYCLELEDDSRWFDRDFLKRKAAK